MTAEITFQPGGQTIRVRSGTTVLEAGRRARVPIRTRCGGRAACLMCKVIVPDQSGLSPHSKQETLKLGSLKEAGYRLACQARIVGKTSATLPEDPLKSVIRAQLAKQKEAEDDF